jgi:hypothetical protein
LRDRTPPDPRHAADLTPQTRDLEILRALCRYRFLPASQMAREWWPGKSLYAAQKPAAAVDRSGLGDALSAKAVAR